MRKALVPMLASLAVCGASTACLFATNAGAEASPRKPVMMALVAPGESFAETATPAVAHKLRRADEAKTAADRKRLCADRYAREVGRMAYLETRLDLTQAERPLFARWKDIKLAIAKRRAADCTSRAARRDRGPLTPIDTMSREQDFLKKRLADLDAERPALASLYKALTPPQREILVPRGFPAVAQLPPDHVAAHPLPMGAGFPPPPPPP
jgi:hypothetical protein